MTKRNATKTEREIKKTYKKIQNAEWTIYNERNNLVLLRIKWYFETLRNGDIFTAENIGYKEYGNGNYYCRFDVKIHMAIGGIGDVKVTFRKNSCSDVGWNYYIDCEKTGWYTDIPENNRLTIQGTLKVRFEDKQNEEVGERVVEIQMKDYSKE